MQATPNNSYVGRFAPSPTGPLHFGSLVAGVASYLQARLAGGQWLLRIEDIDPPREPPGSDELIISALDAYGFEWDGPVTYQSSFRASHDHAIKRLIDQGLAYPCSCSRRDLADVSRGPLGAIYPGKCRNGCQPGSTAIRVITNNIPIAFNDGLQGPQQMCLESESGDFVIRRRDGLVAYHLAVVQDDAEQGISEIVRGIDLLDSTPRHIHLQKLLGVEIPHYVHIPVVENSDGQKLSKLHGATAIPTDDIRPTLVAALEAMSQNPPDTLVREKISSIWEWAVAHWHIDVMDRQKKILHRNTIAETQFPLS